LSTFRASGFGERGVGANADAHDHDLGGQLCAVIEHHLGGGDRRGLAAEVEGDPLLFV